MNESLQLCAGWNKRHNGIFIKSSSEKYMRDNASQWKGAIILEIANSGYYFRITLHVVK